MPMYPMSPYSNPYEVVMQQQAIPKELAEALVHASPETMETIKGTLNRIEGYRTLKEPGTVLAAGAVVALQKRLDQTGGLTRGAVAPFAVRLVQRNPCERDRSISLEGFIRVYDL
ncbi:MAG: hypothetical protein WC654_08550 [Patescibacteria group bacterium]